MYECRNRERGPSQAGIARPDRSRSTAEELFGERSQGVNPSITGFRQAVKEDPLELTTREFQLPGLFNGEPRTHLHSLVDFR